MIYSLYKKILISDSTFINSQKKGLTYVGPGDGEPYF